MIVGEFNGEFLFVGLSEEDCARVAEVSNVADVLLDEDGNRAGAGVGVVDTR